MQNMCFVPSCLSAFWCLGTVMRKPTCISGVWPSGCLLSWGGSSRQRVPFSSPPALWAAHHSQISSAYQARLSEVPIRQENISNARQKQPRARRAIKSGVHRVWSQCLFCRGILSGAPPCTRAPCNGRIAAMFGRQQRRWRRQERMCRRWRVLRTGRWESKPVCAGRTGIGCRCWRGFCYHSPPPCY